MLSAHIFCVNCEMLSVFAYFMLILIQILKCSIFIHFLVNLDFEMLSVFTQFTLLPDSLCCMSRLFEKPTFHIYARSRMTSPRLPSYKVVNIEIWSNWSTWTLLQTQVWHIHNNSSAGDNLMSTFPVLRCISYSNTFTQLP